MMKKPTLFYLTLALILGVSPAFAGGRSALVNEDVRTDFIVAAAYTRGGDDLINVQYADGGKEQITAGGEILLGVGVVFINAGKIELQLSANYHFDDVSAKNGDASFERYPIEALIFRRADRYRIGGGLTLHWSPVAEINIDGMRETVNFDNSFGVVVEYDYKLLDRVWLGLRYTHIDYTVDGPFSGINVDGSHVGLMLNFRF